MLNTSTSGEYRRMDSSLLDGVRAHLATSVVGQRELIDSMLICLVGTIACALAAIGAATNAMARSRSQARNAPPRTGSPIPFT